VDDLMPLGVHLYVAGSFSTAGGIDAKGFAAWDGVSWVGHEMSSSGNGMNGTVSELEVYNDRLIIAGGSYLAGGVPVGGIAAFDGATWDPMNGGSNCGVSALGLYGGDLIAGGCFTTIGGVAASGIAGWDGVSWYPLGSGLGAGTDALVEHEGDLYAGGSFTVAGGAPSDGIARWDGSTWHPVGGGVTGDVWALASYNGSLYVGGQISHFGGNAIEGLARWDGAAWSAVGGGLTRLTYGFVPEVRAMEIYGGELIVGGLFSKAGPLETRSIAAWDGAAWVSLGPGRLNVRDLDIYDGYLLFGGKADIDDVSLWNGSKWVPFGFGQDASVFAVTSYQDHIYVGGTFLTAGGHSSIRIARWGPPITTQVDDPSVIILEPLPPYPNPAGHLTRIPLRVQETSSGHAQVAVQVFDVAGRLVRTVFEGSLPAGRHDLTWDCRSDRDEPCRGVYFIRTRVAGAVQGSQKVVVGLN
jgi:hypothetical protein